MQDTGTVLTSLPQKVVDKQNYFSVRQKTIIGYPPSPIARVAKEGKKGLGEKDKAQSIGALSPLRDGEYLGEECEGDEGQFSGQGHNS